MHVALWDYRRDIEKKKKEGWRKAENRDG